MKHKFQKPFGAAYFPSLLLNWNTEKARSPAVCTIGERACISRKTICVPADLLSYSAVRETLLHQFHSGIPGCSDLLACNKVAVL